MRASSRLFIVTLSRFLKEPTNSLMFPTETELIEAEKKLKQKGKIFNLHEVAISKQLMILDSCTYKVNITHLELAGSLISNSQSSASYPHITT